MKSIGEAVSLFAVLLFIFGSCTMFLDGDKKRDLHDALIDHFSHQAK